MTTYKPGKVERTITVDESPTEKTVIRYGFEYLGGNPDPHFYVTCDTYEKRRGGRWEDAGGGAAHEHISKIAPQLIPIIRWHLCGMDTGPMHYEANAIFWAEVAQGKHERKSYDPDPLAAFRTTVVFGAVESDGTDADAAVTATLTPDELRSWLRARFSALMAAFRRDVDAVAPGLWVEAVEALKA
jgi:hypothetical protein